MLVKLSDPIDAWHKIQNCALRPEQWCMAQQFQGGFFSHVKEVVGKFADVSVLRAAGMAVGRLAPTREEVSADLEIASVMDEFALRCLWLLRGWPFGFLGILGSGQDGKKALHTFRSDLAAYESMVKLDAPPPAVRRYVSRSRQARKLAAWGRRVSMPAEGTWPSVSAAICGKAAWGGVNSELKQGLRLWFAWTNYVYIEPRPDNSLSQVAMHVLRAVSDAVGRRIAETPH